MVDSGGAFLPQQDEIFPDERHLAASSTSGANVGAGHSPVAIVMGSCTAGGAYVPAMSTKHHRAQSGHDLPGWTAAGKAATGEVVTAEELGGADVHSRQSGVTDHMRRTTAMRSELHGGSLLP